MDITNTEVLRQYALLCRRIPNSEIMECVRSAARDALLARGTALSPDATILFDDTKGSVVILVDGHILEGDAIVDANVAVALALRALYEKAQSVPNADKGALLRPISVPSKLGAWFFWIINGAILVYWSIWFVNFIFSAGFREWYEAAGATGDFGFLGLLLFLLLPAIPLVTSASALLARRGFFPEFAHLRALWGFEIPALMSAFIANFVFTAMPLTDGLRYLLVGCYLATLVYWYLSVLRVQLLSRATTTFRFVLGTVTACWLGYATILSVPPIYIFLVEEIIPDLLRMKLSSHLESPLMAMLMIFFAICYFVPLVLVYLVGRNIVRSYRNMGLHAEHVTVISPRIIVWALPVVFLALLAATSWQYSDKKVAERLVLLSQDEGGYASQAARARELVDNKESVDASLRNYLFARERYLFTAEELLRADATGAYLRVVAFPFVYDDKSGISLQGRWGYNPRTSEMYGVLNKGYLRAFGEDLSSVQKQKTVLPGQVHLVSRDVHVVTSGSPVFATVTVTDSLISNLPSDQEVVYEFSLPEEAVVTGLRLGSALEFKGEIAPRGAAQQTYVNQVRMTRDPALLEQTGPRQYRLRVYPVPGVSDTAARTRRENVEGSTQRVQFTYIVLREAGGIPLPTYSERFNIVDESFASTADIDGKKVALSGDGTLLLDRVAKDTLCATKTEIATTFPEGGEARLLFAGGRESGAPPMTLCDDSLTSVNLRGARITFLIDTSFTNKDAVRILLKDLRSIPPTFFSENTVQFIPFSEVMGEKSVLRSVADIPALNDLVFFGKGNIVAALHTMNSEELDSVIVLTGKNPSFSDTATPITLGQPIGAKIVFVHPKGEIPPYPAQFDAFVAPAYSVNVVTDVASALVRAGAPRVEGSTHPYIGAYWYMKETGLDVSRTSTSTMVQLGNGATRTVEQGLLMVMGQHARVGEASRALKRLPMPGTSLLTPYDAWYLRAKSVGIVTPLSSYIALVNDTQRNQLANLSQQANRYTNETTFAVTRPGFVSPLGSARGFSGMGQQSLGLSGTITTSAPPAFIVPSGGAGAPMLVMEDSSSQVYANPAANQAKSAVSVEDNDMLLPRIIMLVATFLLLGGGAFAAYRILRRTHHTDAK